MTLEPLPRNRSQCNYISTIKADKNVIFYGNIDSPSFMRKKDKAFFCPYFYRTIAGCMTRIIKSQKKLLHPPFLLTTDMEKVIFCCSAKRIFQD